MKVTLKLPRLSTNMSEGVLTQWRVAVGDSFRAGDVLYDVETEKVTSEVEAPCDGQVVELLVDADTDVNVGEPICVIEADAPDSAT
jgi:pyruvate/2-oxoglutarate dehydrogenase complex dihydrolipoamide acyltransferase (E2) component